MSYSQDTSCIANKFSGYSVAEKSKIEGEVFLFWSQPCYISDAVHESCLNALYGWLFPFL